MPLYEYRCRKCGKTVEVLQKFSDRPRTRCEQCGGRLEKLLSSSGFILKGAGWYKTDYAGGKKASKPAGDDKPSGAESKPDKPAASGKKTSGKE